MTHREEAIAAEARDHSWTIDEVEALRKVVQTNRRLPIPTLVALGASTEPVCAVCAICPECGHDLSLHAHSGGVCWVSECQCERGHP